MIMTALPYSFIVSKVIVFSSGKSFCKKQVRHRNHVLSDTVENSQLFLNVCVPGD